LKFYNLHRIQGSEIVGRPCYGHAAKEAARDAAKDAANSNAGGSPVKKRAYTSRKKELGKVDTTDSGAGEGAAKEGGELNSQ
jgi:hypothetical protein